MGIGEEIDGGGRSTLAPATAPLWAMEVAGATPAAQWWAAIPGMLEGKVSRPVGTSQVKSPESLAEVLCRLGPESAETRVTSPSGSTPRLPCNSVASSCSFWLHSGIPTNSMFLWMTSAAVWLARLGQTALRISDRERRLCHEGSSWAISLALSKMALTPSAVDSRKNHQMVAASGITLGWTPPEVMTRWLL